MGGFLCGDSWTRPNGNNDLNDVLSVLGMLAASPQDLVAQDRQNPSNSTRVHWLYRWNKLLSTIIQNEKYKMKMTKNIKQQYL